MLLGLVLQVMYSVQEMYSVRYIPSYDLSAVFHSLCLYQAKFQRVAGWSDEG